MAAVRFAVFGLDALVAVTAIWGGIWLVAGVEDARFPRQLLRRTPFTSYVIPGAILGTLVGGSAAFAAAAVIVMPFAAAAAASIAAGVILIGWIAGELLLLRAPSVIEAGYLTTGMAMTALGIVYLTR